MSISEETFLDTLAGISGIVFAPTDNNTNKFLCGDGQWSTTTSTVEDAFWLEG